MNISMILSTQALVLTLFAAICFPYFDAHAQAGDESVNGIHAISQAHPVWLLEQPHANLLTARTYGNSTYGDYDVNASLEISCHSQSPAAYFRLQIAPAELGFNSGPYEGPDANARGTLHITTGTRTAVTHQVSGSWTDGGVFQVGTIFAISTPIPHDELVYWASDASRGQPLKLSLDPKEGSKRLTATFSLPKNNDGLKQVIQPCLNAVAARPVKP
jgi:hypothetical protein